MAPLTLRRRSLRVILVTAIFLGLYLMLSRAYLNPPRDETRSDWKYTPSSFDWSKRREVQPLDDAAVSSATNLSEEPSLPLPRIQHVFSDAELTQSHNSTQLARRDAVFQTAKRSWQAYRTHAFGNDELAPLSLTGRDPLGGWGATLVDSLDTLWIMGLRDEFADAVRRVASIDWNRASSRRVSLFETNIRYLGGLLAAYDLSGEKVLLGKAVELGDMLYAAFDTPSRLPANGFDFDRARRGRLLVSGNEALAAVGSLGLEFARLSQLTGDGKYLRAVDAVKQKLERVQDGTRLPGLWPIHLDLRDGLVTAPRGTTFSLGSGADSAYEYLPKTHLLFDGRDPAYERMYTKAVDTATKYLLFRPMPPPSDEGDDIPDILFSGTIDVASGGEDGKRNVMLIPEIQHLGCFAGGMFALGGKLFGRPEDVVTGERLARGCAWAYEAFPMGVMPETAMVVPCDPAADDGDDDNADSDDDHTTTPPLPLACEWNETLYRHETTTQPPPPFTAVNNPRYLLRPEAIESLFVLYRVTGKADLLDIAWRMFEAVEAAARTARGTYAAVRDVRAEKGQGWVDSMESFWLAETLKYFYLIFSEPEFISLDDYVFNTEAHPFRLDGAGSLMAR
ncbi:hypothetical protein VTJ49DRAFT_4742 [Mycothermus thermophilus]|uniref:alpha-1,2-Mannosidase n=1 Tax=Humicola insolens TaxID=85995 RepID=A0ABR3V5M0_HUMIN